MLFFCNSVSAKEIDCKKYHQEVYGKILRYVFPHSNFVINNCRGGHVLGYSLESSLKTASGKVKIKKNDNFDSEESKHGKGGLKSWREVGSSCKICHAQGPASHPVGIFRFKRY